MEAPGSLISMNHEEFPGTQRVYKGYAANWMSGDQGALKAGYWPGMKVWAASLFIYLFFILLYVGYVCVICLSMCACAYVCVHI